MGKEKIRRPVIAPHFTDYELPDSLGQPTPESFVFVSQKSDLPDAVGGVITLLDHYTYFFTGSVDLTGDRLVSGVNTTILGTSSENASISSTGLTGTALLTSVYTLPMRDISLTADVAVDLQATDNTQALDWSAVNFLNCPTMGLIKDYNNTVFTDCALLSSANLTFDGTIGTVGWSNSIMSGLDGQATVILPATAVITRRFRIIYSAVVAGPPGSTALSISTSATIPVEGYILDTVAFSGSGTYLVGVQPDDNKALVKECTNVVNSASISHYTMLGNATATTISMTNTPVKVAGTTVGAAITQKFTNSTSNRTTYNGAVNRDFKVTATSSCTSGNNNEIGYYIALNGVVIPESEVYVTTSSGGRLDNITIQAVTPLVENDYLEIWVENNTGVTNVTVESLNVIAEALN